MHLDHKDQIFKGQQKEETFVCFFRHHWITLIKEFFLFAILLSLAFGSLIHMSEIQEIIRSNNEIKIVFLTFYVTVTLLMHRFFIRMLNYFVNIGIITDKRVIDHQKTIFFKDVQDSIDLAYIQNIEQFREGMLQTLLQYGDIKIFLAASNTVKTFDYIPNPRFHFRCINRQKEIREKHLGRYPRNLENPDIVNIPLIQKNHIEPASLTGSSTSSNSDSDK